MLAMITALRISYTMAIKIIFFFEVKYRHKIPKCSKSSLTAFGHVEEADREGSNMLSFVPRK